VVRSSPDFRHAAAVAAFAVSVGARRWAQAEAALEVMRRHAVSGNAPRIGVVTDRNHSVVVLRTVVGTQRLSDLLSLKQLPRIC